MRAGRRWPGLPPLAAGLAAVAAGAALASWGLNFGLPYLFRPDEDVLVGRSVRMAAEGSIDPLFANWPPLAFYIVAGAEKLTGNLGGATISDPSGAYLTGRTLSAAAFVATVALVFLAARRAYGDAAAVVAAFALALSPLAVRQAHIATIDFIQTAFVAAALLAGLRAGSVRSFAAAGALCGLAAATKYTGGLSIVFVLAMALQSGRRTRMASASIAGAALAFAIPSAVSLLHVGAYAAGLAFLGGRGFAQDYGTPLGWVYHPTVSLPFGMGLGGYALALGGLALSAVKRTKADQALLAFVATYMLVVGAGHEVFWRYVLPVLPALAMLAGGVLRAIPGRLMAPAVAVAMALLLPSLWASVSTDRLLGTTDTRSQAAAWLMEHAPEGSTIESAYYVSPFYDQAMVDGNRRWVDDELAAGFMQGRYTTRFQINADDPDYVIAGSTLPGQGPPATVPGRPAVATFSAGHSGGLYDPIDAFYLPMWGFAGLERPGPSIVIYGR
jgi:4-amino-4-deoxy-L-arabinose transferase-like glycosyltransferase